MRYEALALDNCTVVRRQRLRAACFTETSANASAVNNSVSSNCASSPNSTSTTDMSAAVCSTTIRAEAPATASMRSFRGSTAAKGSAAAPSIRSTSPSAGRNLRMMSRIASITGRIR